MTFDTKLAGHPSFPALVAGATSTLRADGALPESVADAVRSRVDALLRGATSPAIPAEAVDAVVLAEQFVLDVRGVEPSQVDAVRARWGDPGVMAVAAETAFEVAVVRATVVLSDPAPTGA